jgi:hypothetical protein
MRDLNIVQFVFLKQHWQVINLLNDGRNIAGLKTAIWTSLCSNAGRQRIQYLAHHRGDGNDYALFISKGTDSRHIRRVIKSLRNKQGDTLFYKKREQVETRQDESKICCVPYLAPVNINAYRIIGFDVQLNIYEA